jgi:very-short-patch-repair endonuclease
VTLRNGIPVTTPARTIADLRLAAWGSNRLVSPWELRRAIRQVDVLGLPSGDDVKRDRTRSDLERDFLHLCERHRLPVPEVNVRIGRHLVDFLWRDQRLVVETDGYRYHGGRAAFQEDRARDLDLRARGFEVIRLAEKQIEGEPGHVAEVLSAVIGGRVAESPASRRHAAP